ncbi:tRNA (guanosine(37)-N1)-methyltransferase TrmD [candidate division WOR-3 bacterium]|nr:tRNA (guanosine(37)-N1)-methyltransferase TrmD [candidate division WOR-3 bacterium]
MNINIITLFPELIQPDIENGLIRQAIKKGLLNINIIDLRPFGIGKHHLVDDYPYGGGSGMILMPEPLKAALDSIENPGLRILMTPSGQLLDQEIIENELLENVNCTIIAGRYKSVDQRFIDSYIDIELSIGDYILQGGEIPALIILESVSRLVNGVMNNIESAKTDSFSSGLLDAPQYTRPEIFEKTGIPEVLLSGHHENVDKWRLEQALRKTMNKRPDLIENKDLTNKEKKIINTIELEDKNG